MMEIIVRPVEPHEEEVWDAFIRSSGTGTLFHTSIWKSVINLAYDDGVYTLIGAYVDENLVGGFSALTRKRLGVATAVTPLNTPYVGFVVKRSYNTDGLRGTQVITELAQYLRRYRFQNIQCVPGLPDLHFLGELGYNLAERLTLEIDLQQPEEKLWKSFRGHVRRNIKKAEKSGFEISSRWDGDRGYQIFSEIFDRQGKACPVPEKLFREIADGEILSKYRRRYCAWRDGRMEAFLVATRFNGRVFYELTSTSTDVLQTGISSLLIWDMLKDHLDGNWEVFDFVGGNIPSVSIFKFGFSPSVRNYFAAEYCSSRRIAVALKAQKFLRRR